MRVLAWCSAALAGFLVVTAMTASALVGSQSQAFGAPTSVADIPPEYLQLYVAAAQRHKLDWAILAAIGKVETDHGRIQSGRCATSSAGARGPMQFMSGTWASYGNGGDVCDPADAIPAAARYLRASGAPKDYHVAIFAYNHAGWYVRKVLDQAEKYRRASAAPVYGGDIGGATAQDVVNNSRIVLSPGQRADLLSGGIDPRVLASLQWLGSRHTIVVTALRRDHSPGSNHEAGRAVDIGAVDGQACEGSVDGKCGQAVMELAGVDGAMRSTELIYCFDPDGPSDPRGFARGDHCNHIHLGFDG